MVVSDDAVLEFIFNTESQGLSLDAISATVDCDPKYTIPEAVLCELQELEKEAIGLSESDPLKALSLLNECIARCETYASAYNNRAQLYRMTHELDKALADLNRVIDDLGEGQPKILKQAYTQRAIVKRQLGDLQASRSDFEMGAKLGNPLARNIAVHENPYAKMCNQVMMQVMQSELNK